MSKHSKRSESRNRYLTRKVAQQRGWNTDHVQRGGNFLEEQEIEDVFPDIGLDGKKPDFLVVLKGSPLVVVESKNDASKIEEAYREAIEYANQINSHGKYSVRTVVGAAGEEDHGFIFRVGFLAHGQWGLLSARGHALTSFPSASEVEAALATDNGTTEVSVPDVSAFIDVAIELSEILRSAKIEPQLRPKVLGAMITALYWGEVDLSTGEEIESINTLAQEAIESTDHFSDKKKEQLAKAIELTEADFNRMRPKVGRIAALLKSLNIRSVLQTDTDFLGILYEAFIRYGYDNNSLGIVFTPRHITRFCADLVNVQAGDKVIDVACGSGGFLVAAFDREVRTSEQQGVPFSVIRSSLAGFDTNPTVWSLAALNMFFRGDGKSHIENMDCFSPEARKMAKGVFDIALLNPPFSQVDEPERDFISVAIDALKARGLLAVVVKSGIFADAENADWRGELLKNNRLLGVISLPAELFYPTAVDTSIMVLRAKTPHRAGDHVFMAKVWNDGYAKLKGKRIESPQNDLPQVKKAFEAFMNGDVSECDNAILVEGSKILVKGAEFSPENYLPQLHAPEKSYQDFGPDIQKSILLASMAFPALVDEILPDFPCFREGSRPMPYGALLPLEDFFHIHNGRSSGFKNYQAGRVPYISSGDPNNGIVGFAACDKAEVFVDGGITVSCFGYAAVQPWAFMARGNGGSSVRVLSPRFDMTLQELIWFAAQINAHRWRFPYGRMAIKRRLEKLEVASPQQPLPDGDMPIAHKIQKLNESYDALLRR